MRRSRPAAPSRCSRCPWPLCSRPSSRRTRARSSRYRRTPTARRSTTRSTAPAEAAASNNSANYYAWSPKPGLRFVSIDTVSDGGVIGPSANGNIDNPQFLWLQGQLAAAQAANELIVLFGHHPVRSLDANVPDEVAPACLVNDLHGHDVNPGCDSDPRSSQPVKLGADLQGLLNSYSNVIAYVAGHTHEHKITPFPRPGGPAGSGWWGIETASEVDWPVQSRLLEVFDNGNGTLSIFGTAIDHAGPVTAPGTNTVATGLAPDRLAAIGRELAFNDPQAGGATGVGAPGDRNVELLLDDPRS